MKIDLYRDKVLKLNKLSLIKSAIVLNGSDFNPPHVGLLLNNMYFSSTANGLKINVPFEHIFNAFKRRKHKVIIASTNVNIDLPLALEIFKLTNVSNPSFKIKFHWILFLYLFLFMPKKR